MINDYKIFSNIQTKASFENWYSETGGHNFLQNTQGVFRYLTTNVGTVKFFEKNLYVTL